MAGSDEKMDLSNDSRTKFLEEDRLLPWRYVNYTTWTKLANKLDLPSPVSNNDWRGLAEHLGFTTEDILLLESNSGAKRKTIALFENFMPQSDATVNKVAKALQQMNRDDALQILLDAVPEIEERYLADQQQASSGGSGLEAVETDHHCITTLPQGCRCLGSPVSLHLSSQRGGGGCSPCHTHSQCNVMASSCCCHRLPSHCHTPAVQCSTLATSHRGHSPVISHPHMNRGATSPLNSTPAHSTTGKTSLSGASTKYSIPPITRHDASGLSKMHMAEGLYGPESLATHSECSDRRNARLPVQQQHQFSDSVVPAYSHPTLDPDSMAVHPDTGCHRRALQSFNSNDIEMDGEHSEEPAPLPNAIARGEGRLMSGINIPPLPMDMSVDDEPSTTTEELSSSDSLPSIPGQYNIMRQVSEECNAKQPYSTSAASTHRNSLEARAMSPAAHRLDRQASSPWPRSGVAVERGGEVKDGGRMRGGMVRGGSQDNPSSSLHHLSDLAKLPDRFMPDPKYTTMVAEQQIEDLSPSTSGKRGPFPNNVKRERDAARRNRYPSSESTDNSTTSSRSGSSQNGVSRSIAKGENPRTFPMRVKPQSGGAMVEEVRHLLPGQLTKTTSVPIDMKVEEFRKAFRHIKVFVTYSNDSKQHSRQVLSLCNCLDRNGFSCCVDVYSRHEESADQQQASRDWCGRKFKEADFILVCISPQYLREIDSTDKSVGAPSNSSGGLLHSAFIYQMMQEEFRRTGKCSRFVPLYFEGSSGGQGPGWLTRQLAYHWPQQYKDLLWMLTKPEERMKQRLKPGGNRNHSSGGLNGHRSPLLSSVH